MKQSARTEVGEEPRTPAAGRAPRPVPTQRRGGVRPVPVLDPAYAHLSIDALRAYRSTLEDEENKVSYWRRLLQGRLDVVAGGTRGASVPHEKLGKLLSSERVSAGRRALAAVGPVDDIPALPRLAELWDRQVAADDEAGREAFLTDLRDAETALSEYRAALHLRIAEATGELIARYRAEPDLCLSALPVRRPSAG